MNCETKFSAKLTKKVKKKKQQKIARVWPRKVSLLEMEAITSIKTRNYKEKTKSIFDREK